MTAATPPVPAMPSSPAMPPALSTRRTIARRRAVATALVGAVLAVGAMAAARLATPDDLWDHAQPRTIAYAVDLLESGRWILPRDAHGLPTTKPPLHPWLATPAVAVLGPASRLGHLAPSLLAVGVTAALLVLAARRWWGPGGGTVLGAVAVIAWIATPLAARTAFLARPDMILTACLFGAWVVAIDVAMAARAAARTAGRAANSVAPLAAVRRQRRGSLLLYGALLGLGGLAKGPAILPVLIGVPLAIWLGAGPRRCAVWFLGPAVLALALGPIGLWLELASRQDPVHVASVLLGSEVLDRIAGQHPDAGGGWASVVLGLGHMPFYLFVRTAPWSLAAAAGVCLVVWPGLAVRRRPQADRLRAVLVGLVVVPAVAVLVFSLGAGKRADYLAPVGPMVGLLAAWWLVRGDRRWFAGAPWLPAVVGLVMAAGVGWMAARGVGGGQGVDPAAGDALVRLAAATRSASTASTTGAASTANTASATSAPQPRPWVVLDGPATPLATRLGQVPAAGDEVRTQLLDAGTPHLVAWATLEDDGFDVAAWLAADPRIGRIRRIHGESGRHRAGSASPGWRTALFEVEPAGSFSSEVDPGSDIRRGTSGGGEEDVNRRGGPKGG